MQRRLLRDGQIAIDDWRYVAEAAADPSAPLIVTFDQWRLEPGTWLARGGRLGVVLSPEHHVEQLAPDLAHFALIAAEFPGPSEGRGYTQARLLRERWNFKGELRATGQVLRDQFVFMLRAGFDAFEVKKESDAEAFAATVKRYSVFYQPTGDGRVTALHRRMQLRDSESAGQ